MIADGNDFRQFDTRPRQWSEQFFELKKKKKVSSLPKNLNESPLFG
jgi:hypothetical protein